MQSIGDMAQALVLRTNQVRLRQEMDTLAAEISTGFVKDPAKHLAGDLTSLMAIDRSLQKLETYRVNTAEAALVTGTMQTALDQMQDRTETVAQVLISADLTPSGTLQQTMAEDARAALGQVLSDLNASVAGRFLFSGTATDRAAVQDVDQLMADLSAAVAGQTTLVDIETQLDTWFATAGGFDTTTYQGSATGLAALQLSDSESASVDIRATDPAFRDIVKSLALAALAGDGTLTLTPNVKSDMLSKAGTDLLGAQKPLVELRAGLGALEARVEETATRNAAERTATSLARLDLVGADPYESASRYENIRGQLESLYAITARSQRLSLAEYL
ncbi:MAG: flagellin [Paracoccaceae bacterium]|nr:flagellin [Paracoccaceae bacterium]